LSCTPRKPYIARSFKGAGDIRFSGSTTQIEKILKDLEQERDNSLQAFSSEDLVDLFLRMQINVFTSIYFLALVEFKDEIKDLGDTYRSYFRSRVNAVRYLLELYLTCAYIVQSTDRFNEVYSLSISQKVNLYINDLDLHKRANNIQKQPTLDALNARRAEYIKFISTFGNFSNKMPKSIDDIINNSYENGQISKNKLENNAKSYGFKYFKNNSINFSNEIKNNANIDKRQRENMFRAYDLLSIDVHPTVASLTELEKFIGANLVAKRDQISKRDELSISLLRIVGEHMLSLARKLIAEKVNAPI